MSPAPARECGDDAVISLPIQWDRHLRAELAVFTAGISPASLALALLDWSVHLAVSPGKYWKTSERWLAETISDQFSPAPFSARPAVAGDPRFASPDWQQWPHCAWRDDFLRCEQWWQALTTDIDGLSAHHQRLTAFCARQWLDPWSPSNVWWMNPAVLHAAVKTRGGNFLRGLGHWLEDCRNLAGEVGHEPVAERPLAYVPGRDVAITPGKVIFRNKLFELIQYTPTTAEVHEEPLLIVPSWIMKYYILDLQPEDSMVRYLVAHGHTVYIMSWRNPGAEAHELGLDDYLESGLMTALHVVHAQCGAGGVHAAGYCLGGTLLAIAAARLARDAGGVPLRSMTLFATATDFEEPGELGLYIDDSALSTLEALMRKQGYLDGPQLATAFQMLNARDLVWSRIMGEYLLGERTRPSDLISWNQDTTRLPCRLHTETLRRLFLDNELAEGHYCLGGRPVALSDIDIPVFMVGTEHDHVSPWRSVYKLHLLTRNALTFLLTSGGHNAGIVSEPGHPRRRFRVQTRPPGAAYRDPDRYLTEAEQHEGSWWPFWQAWLAANSGKLRPARAPEVNALADAPGQYVLET
ncbi:polyhydroxyalkanoate synthase [Cupriavidus sp. YR651]|nr:polyhydroxyalkanoate synthase [Cupriavidus sp. YR651]